MPADSHIVGMELMVADIFRNGLFHHFQVGTGPGLFHHQALADSFVFIAHIGMREVPAVIFIRMVMISYGLVAKALELVAHNQGQGVSGGTFKTPDPSLRDKTGTGHIFPVRGADTPQRSMEICKSISFLDHFVQRGGDILPHCQMGKALCRNEY